MQTPEMHCWPEGQLFPSMGSQGPLSLADGGTHLPTFVLQV